MCTPKCVKNAFRLSMNDLLHLPRKAQSVFILSYNQICGHSTGLTALVTRIAATSKSQIASDCNRNSKKSLRLRKHPLKPTLWTRESPVLCGFYSVSEALHGSGNPQNTLRLQGCDSESQRFFWPNAIFVIATLRFYCDFCGKSLRLRSCDCQSLAICDCDCVGH